MLGHTPSRLPLHSLRIAKSSPPGNIPDQPVGVIIWRVLTPGPGRAAQLRRHPSTIQEPARLRLQAAVQDGEYHHHCRAEERQADPGARAGACGRRRWIPQCRVDARAGEGRDHRAGGQEEEDGGEAAEGLQPDEGASESRIERTERHQHACDGGLGERAEHADGAATAFARALSQAHARGHARRLTPA